MSKLINKTMCIDGRYWTVLKVNELLEVVYVQELDRRFCTVITYDEIKQAYPTI